MIRILQSFNLLEHLLNVLRNFELQQQYTMTSPPNGLLNLLRIFKIFGLPKKSSRFPILPPWNATARMSFNPKCCVIYISLVMFSGAFIKISCTHEQDSSSRVTHTIWIFRVRTFMFMYDMNGHIPVPDAFVRELDLCTYQEKVIITWRDHAWCIIWAIYSYIFTF
jgi:hypothetical protein